MKVLGRNKWCRSPRGFGAKATWSVSILVTTAALGVFATSASASVDVDEGIDLWFTPPGATYSTAFDSSALPQPGTPIPADFFFPDSDPFSGTIPLVGVPLEGFDPTDPDNLFPTDTIVERLQPGDFNPDFDPVTNCPAEVTVPIQIVALSLMSIDPIKVTSPSGDQLWDVYVCLSDVPQALGSMTIRHNCPAGGDFDSDLPVQVKFIFTPAGAGPDTCVGEIPGNTDNRCLDTGIRNLPPDMHVGNGIGWVHDPNAAFEIVRVNPGTQVDGNCDGAPDPELAGTSNFVAGIFPIPCECSTPPGPGGPGGGGGSFQSKRLTNEDAMLAAHGALPSETPEQVTCCLADGSCVELSPGPCPIDANEVIGMCTASQGCCLPGGACADLDPLCCLDLGGIPQGDMTACTVPEACCLSGGACVEVDPLCCDDLNGALPGEPACLGDANGDGADDACVPFGGGCFPDCNKLNIECLNPSREYDNRKPVGRLLSQGVGICTGWIIGSPNCIITNRHCITTNGDPFGPLVADITTRSIEFNFECEQCFSGPCKPVDTYQVVELIHENASLDYALLKVQGDPAAIWGTLVVSSNPPVIDEQIYEIHHAGVLKKGFDDGVVTAHTIPGTCIPGTAEEVDFTAIASGGASGSPVFRKSDHCVMGICHCGPHCAPGSGIPMSAVLPDALPHIIAEGCAIIECPPPGVQACCLPDGTCFDTTVDDCVNNRVGLPQGPGTTCVGTTCPSPEACCGFGGQAACIDLPRSQCSNGGGTPGGLGTSCTAPQACCRDFGDGCQNEDPVCCGLTSRPGIPSGIPQGPGTACLLSGIESGACCFPGGTCDDNLEATHCCDDRGGILPPGAPQDCLGDADGNGIDDVCEDELPTVSTWGIAAMLLLLLTGIVIKFGRRPAQE